MAGSAQFEIRKAIYKALNDDSTLTTTHGASVYQIVPDDSALPYVVISSAREQLLDTMGNSGREISIDVSTWTNAAADETLAYDISSRVLALLDWATLDATKLGSWTGVSINLVSSIENTIDSESARYKNIVQTFLVRVHA